MQGIGLKRNLEKSTDFDSDYWRFLFFYFSAQLTLFQACTAKVELISIARERYFTVLQTVLE